MSILTQNFESKRDAVPIGLDPYGLLARRNGCAVFNPILQNALELQHTIPKIIHCIWLGKPLDRANNVFWQNVCKVNQVYKELGYTLFMWCNDSSMDEDFCKLCKIEKIQPLHVFDVFASGNDLKLESAIRYNIESVPPNFGEASDLLRYNILLQYGGIYMDEDTAGVIEKIDAIRAQKLLDDLIQRTTEPLKISVNSITDNDFFVTFPKHPFFLKILSVAEVNYNKQDDLTWLMYSYTRSHKNMRLHLRIGRTVARTGPALVHDICIDPFFRCVVQHFPSFNPPYSHSWRAQKLPLSENDLPAIFTTMLREFKESQNTAINLFYYDGLGAKTILQVLSVFAEKYPEMSGQVKYVYTIHIQDEEFRKEVRKIFPNFSFEKEPRIGLSVDERLELSGCI